MLYTEVFDRKIVNNDATIISHKILPVTTQLNTSKSINKFSESQYSALHWFKILPTLDFKTHDS